MLPVEIPGLGKADEAPTLNTGANLAQTTLSPEDYFVLSRIDGGTTVKQICLVVSGMLPESKTVEILKKLKRTGAIRIGEPIPVVAAGTPAASPRPPARGETRPPAPRAARMATPIAMPRAERVPAQPVSPAPDTRPVSSTVVIDESLLLEDGDLDMTQKRRILEYYSQLGKLTYFELFGLAHDADKKDVKRAYFKLSKEFHPDRFYKKQLGTYAERLASIFKQLTIAFEILSDDGQRAAYLLSLQAGARTR